MWCSAGSASANDCGTTAVQLRSATLGSQHNEASSRGGGLLRAPPTAGLYGISGSTMAGVVAQAVDAVPCRTGQEAGAGLCALLSRELCLTLLGRARCGNVCVQVCGVSAHQRVSASAIERQGEAPFRWVCGGNNHKGV